MLDLPVNACDYYLSPYLSNRIEKKTFQLSKTPWAIRNRCRTSIHRMPGSHNSRSGHMEMQLSAGTKSHRSGVNGESPGSASGQLFVASVVSSCTPRILVSIRRLTKNISFKFVSIIDMTILLSSIQPNATAIECRYILTSLPIWCIIAVRSPGT